MARLRNVTTIVGFAGVPAGVVTPYSAASAPDGWLLCDGSAVSRTTYADLFAAINTIHGSGDGSTTFNIPDLRQKFILGKANSGTGNVLGTTGGAIDHSHSIPSHYHAMGAGADLSISGGTHTTAVDHTHSAGTTGAGTAHTHGNGTIATGAGTAHSHSVTGITLSNSGTSISASSVAVNITISDPGHSHGVSDPGHSHGVSDPGHNHTSLSRSQGSTASDSFLARGPISANVGTQLNFATSGDATGISINGAGTGVSVNGAGTGISLNSGNHSHTINISDPGHTHSVTGGTVGSESAHTHPITGSLASESAHTHSFSTPAFVGNSASDGSHTHSSGNISGRIGNVTTGVDGNSGMTSGTTNPPFYVLNHIIKY